MCVRFDKPALTIHVQLLYCQNESGETEEREFLTVSFAICNEYFSKYSLTHRLTL